MGANVITSKSFPLTTISKEIDAIYKRTMADAPAEYSQVLNVQTAPKGPTFYQAEYAGLDMLPKELAEAESVQYASTVEGNPIVRHYNQFGLGYVITDLMLKDELWGRMKKLPADLAKAMQVYIEIAGLELYNTAESTGTATVKDGKALCAATGHELLNDQLNNGTQYNIPVTAGDLSETTFKEALEYFDNMVDENGFPKMMSLDKLVVSQSDKYIAHRLRTQMYGGSSDAAGLIQTGTNPGVENMLNMANPQHGFVDGWNVHALRYLDDDRWFALSNEHDNGFYWKEQPKQTRDVDFDTDNIKYKSKMRFGVWAYEYAGTFGNITGVSQS